MASGVRGRGTLRWSAEVIVSRSAFVPAMYPKIVKFGRSHKVFVNQGLEDSRVYAIVHRRNSRGKFAQVPPWELTEKELAIRARALRRVGA